MRAEGAWARFCSVRQRMTLASSKISISSMLCHWVSCCGFQVSREGSPRGDLIGGPRLPLQKVIGIFRQAGGGLHLSTQLTEFVKGNDLANMSNIAKEMRLAPDITSIESSQPSLLEHGFFPPSYCLIVTTNRAVYSWDMDGITELFRSKSEGIVAARKLSSDSEMLAVADSQVVILHDTNKGMQRSYRLKGSEVCTAIHQHRN